MVWIVWFFLWLGGEWFLRRCEEVRGWEYVLYGVEEEIFLVRSKGDY